MPDLTPDQDNIISTNYSSFLDCHFYKLDPNGNPTHLLFSGRLGITEKELIELDLDKISSQDISQFCSQGENQYLEFKSAEILLKKERDNLLLEIEAFANTNPGIILIGVGDKPENKGEIQGIEDVVKKLDKTEDEVLYTILEAWLKRLDPIPSVTGKIIEIPEYTQKLIVLKIEYDPSKLPITFNGKVVTRVYSSVHPASQAEILRLTKT